jgi:cytidylate kinase
MPIITISRGTFSGGESLAKAIANQLGYRCLGREVILEAAREYGVPIDDLRVAMETPPSLWERVVGHREAYLTYFRAALSATAQADKLVYHGHVGHLLLPGVSHVLRVRVVADLEIRLQAVMRKLQCERPEARAYIERMDRERARWVRFLFGVDWEDPHLYDVILHLDRMSLATACETVCGLAARPEYLPTPISRQVLQDLGLASHVEAVLMQDPRTQNAKLRILASEGNLVITGEAWSPEAVDAVPEVARQVAGVAEVRARVRLAATAYAPLPF